MRVASKVGTFLPNVGLWVLKLFAMYATDEQTDRQTDGRTDGRTDKSNAYFPIPSLRLEGGIIKTWQVHNNDMKSKNKRQVHKKLKHTKIVTPYQNKCIGDDTKAAARQSLHCIKNKNKKIWRKTIFNMADGIITPCNVTRS